MIRSCLLPCTLACRYRLHIRGCLAVRGCSACRHLRGGRRGNGSCGQQRSNRHNERAPRRLSLTALRGLSLLQLARQEQAKLLQLELSCLDMPCHSVDVKSSNVINLGMQAALDVFETLLSISLCVVKFESRADHEFAGLRISDLISVLTNLSRQRSCCGSDWICRHGTICGPDLLMQSDWVYAM